MIKKKQSCDYLEDDYERDDYELYHKYYYKVIGNECYYSSFFVALVVAMKLFIKRVFTLKQKGENEKSKNSYP